MNSFVFLYAASLSSYALEPLSNGSSAFFRAIESCVQMPHASNLVIIGDKNVPLTLPQNIKIPIHIRTIEQTINTDLFLIMQEEVSRSKTAFDTIFFTWADCPYLDIQLTKKLYEQHLRYAAEYTFAEGYPYGLAPELLAPGIIPILHTMAKKTSFEINRTCVFDTLKQDINSFDIETDLAPEDVRYLRLSLICDSKRNKLLCERLSSITSTNYADLVIKNEKELRTLPAFFAIQISSRCPHECIFCPYPQTCRGEGGIGQGIVATKREEFMLFSDFETIINKIESFSDDAVISLSLWGEASYHPEILRFIKLVLQRPHLSLLIETTGLGWQEKDIEDIMLFVKDLPSRTNGFSPINWIISLDAISASCYALLHKADEQSFREALSFTEKLLKAFPESVWPQCIRMNENEGELEPFYRFWKEKAGKSIIQKYDHFCNVLPDRKVADLSPLKRRPCWHLKRGISILIDGTVPLCKEDIKSDYSLGNILKVPLENIWSQTEDRYKNHCNNLYQDICEGCDEYYTYTF